ncbi:tetratricopeptide repeat protein [Actinomadura sp. KC216]|uniref:tetratricopeptide repeat protein n=1 Tax=Actinomadura sp. KC216 TaxID=2530370 RepID=UPI00140534F4|nr:tetratricopeptide repeat protein [Actinomadura sp. KC216]
MAVGVAINQILNGGTWNLMWLIISLTAAMTAESINVWIGRQDNSLDQQSIGPPAGPGNTAGHSTDNGSVHISQERPIPRQLPRQARHFTDREVERSKLDDLRRSTADLVVVSGLGGVGKTALAVHWGHQNKDHFPDGQFYANLHGYAPGTSIAVEDVLDNFLRALGLAPERIPRDPDAMAAAFRSEISGRRMLIILDNVRTATQVRPILPSSGNCMVLVTSRSRLKPLIAQDGAELIVLKPLTESDALALLQAVADRDNSLHHDSMTILARQCGFLPLTLRIIAEYIRGQDGEFIEDLIGEPRDQKQRLTFPTGYQESMSVPENVFSRAYDFLAPDAARMFRLTGLLKGADFSVEAAAAVAGVGVMEARQLLSLLMNENLLEKASADRYQFHDLVKAYAIERLNAEESAVSRKAAAHRVLSFYLRTADNVDHVIAPQRRHVLAAPSRWAKTFDNPQSALSWCEAERLNLIAAIDQSVLLGFEEIGWKLPIALTYFFILNSHPVNRHRTALVAVDAARRAGDRYAEAWGETCVGGAELALGRAPDALGRFQRALSVCMEINDTQGQAINLGNVANTLVQLERYEEALDHANESLRLFRSLHDQRSESIELRLIGSIHRGLGDNDEASRLYHAAVNAAHGVDLQSEGDALQELGELARSQKKFPAAVTWFQKSIDVRRRIDDKLGLATSLLGLGSAFRALDDTHMAYAALSESLTMYELLGNAKASEVREILDNITGQP